jgi:hypothetical protein
MSTDTTVATLPKTAGYLGQAIEELQEAVDRGKVAAVAEGVNNLDRVWRQGQRDHLASARRGDPMPVLQQWAVLMERARVVREEGLALCATQNYKV